MCPFYSAQLFEITGTTKGVFTHSQSSCHIAKVVLALDSRQIPIASDAPPRHTFRGFLHWRFADAGPGARGAVIMRPASDNLHNSGYWFSCVYERGWGGPHDPIPLPSRGSCISPPS